MSPNGLSIAVGFCLVALFTVSVPALLSADVHAPQPVAPAVTKSNEDLNELKKLLRIARSPVKEISAELNLGGNPAKGNPNAVLTIVEFGDYECPFCRKHFMTNMPRLDREYVETGKVRYVFFDFPRNSQHKNAFKAAEAARCAGEQGQYWKMHDHLYKNARALHPSMLPAHAQAVGLKVTAFEECLSAGRYKEAVEKDVAAGEELLVRGTPTFFIGTTTSDGNGMQAVLRISGAHPYDVLSGELDKLLAKHKAN
jgi:protein-disulfide isomerase